MKKNKFNEITVHVSTRFGILKSDLFLKNSKRRYSRARYMVYHLCDNIGMRPSMIQDYMSDEGYFTGHANIIRGIKESKRYCRKDSEYESSINTINSWVTD